MDTSVSGARLMAGQLSPRRADHEEDRSRSWDHRGAAEYIG